MYPGVHARTFPDKPAVVMGGSGEVVTFGELEERSNRLAQLWWEMGLRPGGHVAIFLENHPRYFEVFWAAVRSGLYLTTVNRYLTADEAAYIVNDCGARSLISSRTLQPVAEEIASKVANCPRRLMIGGEAEGWETYESAVSSYPATPLSEEPRGRLMLYSSGTTGRPKGIKRPLTGAQVGDPDPQSDRLIKGLFGIDESSVYLSPAPLYHSAPIAFCGGVQGRGGTVVVMERFDPEEALRSIEEHRITVSQWVPTMFVRMLKLPSEVRERADLTSHRMAIHAAAPCPIEVKRRMIEWWGPILTEYYAGSEGNGLCFIDSETWLRKPGSVGQPANAVIHICDDEGNELPAGEPGVVYLEQSEEYQLFEYHNDEEKTASSRNPHHRRWTTLGDIGYLDEDGFLFLTDRKAFMIISGGVNIYPQEIENVLVLHPLVADVAVIGVPSAEMGEEVKGVVQLLDPSQASEAVAEELLAYARGHLASYKVPKTIDFEPELPRLPTGKLYKRVLRERYWPGQPTPAT